MDDNNQMEGSSEILGQIESQVEQPQPTAEVQTDVDQPSVEAPTGEQPRKLAGKFDSVEALEKSYSELESQFTRTRQEASVPLEEELYNFNGNAETEMPLDEQAEVFNKLVDERVSQRTDPLVAKLEIAEAKANYGEKFDELKPHVLKIYDEYPELRKPGNLNRVIRLAKAEMLDSVEKEAREEGKNEAITKAEEAERAQTESAARSSSRGSKSALSPDSVGSMSSEELLSMLPH